MNRKSFLLALRREMSLLGQALFVALAIAVITPERAEGMARGERLELLAWVGPLAVVAIAVPRAISKTFSGAK